MARVKFFVLIPVAFALISCSAGYVKPAAAEELLMLKVDAAVELYEKGDYAGAQAAFEELLPTHRRVLGVDHPETLKVMNNLAVVLLSQGKYGEAQKRFEEVLATSRRLLGEDHPFNLTAMGNLASSLWAQGDFTRTREIEEDVLATSRRVLGEDHPSTLLAMANLAVGFYDRGDFTRARELQEEDLSRSRQALGEDHPHTLLAMRNLASTLAKLGDLARAREMYEEVLPASRRVLGEDHPNTLLAMGDLGSTLREQGDFTGAREIHEYVLSRSRRVLGEDHPDTLKAMANLASTLFEQGYDEQVREIEEKILATRQRVLGHDHPDTLMAMANLARTLYRYGDFARVRAMEEEVLATRRRVLGEDHHHTWLAMSNLATTVSAQGDYTSAQELFEEVLATRRRALGEDHPDTFVAMGNLASTLKRLGDLTQARELFEEILSRGQPVLGEDHPVTLTAMAHLASTLKKQGEFEEARRFFQEVLLRRQRTLGEKHPDTLAAMHNLASTLQSQKEIDGARELYEKVVNIRQSILGPDHKPNTVEEAWTLFYLGLNYRDSRRTEEAVGCFLQALGALEAQTARVDQSDDVRSTYKAGKNEIYRTALRTFLDLGRTSQALHVLERYRAQSFLEMVSRRDFLLADLPPELADSRRNLAVRYDRSMRELDRLMTARDADGIAAVRREQRDLHRERERIQAEVRRISPRLAEIEDPRPLTAAEIRQTLEPGTLLLSYSVGYGGTNLFTLSRGNDLEVYQLPINWEELRKQVEIFDERVHGGSWSDQSASRLTMGDWLYKKLIGPVADRIEKSERLLIIADGPLHYLPFSALVRDTTATGDAESDWQYLIEWKPIHTVLSGTVYAQLRELRPNAQPDSNAARLRLAAFGAPIYPGMNPGTAGAASTRTVLRAAVSRGLFDSLTSLPHSRREVNEISQLFSPEPVDTFLGANATEEEAKKALGKDVNIVHFAVHGLAVHGLADPLTPLDSFLAFTIPKKPEDGSDNGLLQAWEIFESVRLDADLVVLSGCETAMGPERGGEGLISLSRAFQFAGARSVLASLWRVNDQSTSELMIRFYRHLRDGKPKDEALQAAQIELIRGGPNGVVDENGNAVEKDYSAPYHWAAFQLIGDWQ